MLIGTDTTARSAMAAVELVTFRERLSTAVVQRAWTPARDEAALNVFLEVGLIATLIVEQRGHRADLATWEVASLGGRPSHGLVPDRPKVWPHLLLGPWPNVSAWGFLPAPPADPSGGWHAAAGLLIPSGVRFAVASRIPDMRSGNPVVSGGVPTGIDPPPRALPEPVRLLGTNTTDRSDALGAAETARISGLEGRIMDYIQQRLTDPDLGAGQIAGAHNISVRYLYKLLARSDISLGSWIRAQRLELCRRAFEADKDRRRTIAAIAHGAGFGDLTHFARSFKKAYGLSPSEYRAARAATLVAVSDAGEPHLADSMGEPAQRADVRSAGRQVQR